MEQRTFPSSNTPLVLDEWKLINNLNVRSALDKQQTASTILLKCDRTQKRALEVELQTRENSDHYLENRISELNFRATELQFQRQELCVQIEVIETRRTQIADLMPKLKDALEIGLKCEILRNQRIGTDFVYDGVDKAIEQEIKTICDVMAILRRVLEELAETMRRLRAARYAIDRDLTDKEIAMNIDKTALNLKPTDLGLCVYEGFSNIDPANISSDEYNNYVTDNLRRAAQEVNSARQVRDYIDTLMKQLSTDLKEANHLCNKAFEAKVQSTNKAKVDLELMHAEIVVKVLALQESIETLKRDLESKQKSAALAHTRLGRRANRPGMELVKDSGNQALLMEIAQTRLSVQEIQQMLIEATATLRYLLQTQIQLEEDINVKMNTIKIDEVDCMTLRKGIAYQDY